MTITRLKFQNFTAFRSLDMNLSPGINIFVGANGTGKTHLMKVAYAACDITKTQVNFVEKMIRVFLPANRAIGRLVTRQRGSSDGSIEIRRNDIKLRASFSNHSKVATSAKITGANKWMSEPIESVFIPVKEMLSNAPGFRSLYAQREIHFPEVYADIIDRAYRPTLRGPMDPHRRNLLEKLRKIMTGKVEVKDEEFFLRSKQGRIEFSLLAEGMRKLGLLWLLIQNGTLLNGSVLFWDEPEANLNPKLFGAVVDILLELQRNDVQVFLATHDYVILKEFDLRTKPEDRVVFHSLFHDESGNIRSHSTSDFLQIHPNAIAETFIDLYNREVERSLGGYST